MMAGMCRGFRRMTPAFIGDSPTARVLPGFVIRTLQKHFYVGVKHAELRFKYTPRTRIPLQVPSETI